MMGGQRLTVTQRQGERRAHLSRETKNRKERDTQQERARVGRNMLLNPALTRLPSPHSTQPVPALY
uniref:Uncharacterized protein n=1 Tax=Callorhinchus milii TaxID=7868 RepID=A0A4W3IVQ3_CALMI